MTPSMKPILATLAILFLIAFHHAMMADRAALCGNDETAYRECSE